MLRGSQICTQRLWADVATKKSLLDISVEADKVKLTSASQTKPITTITNPPVLRSKPAPANVQ